MKKRLYFAARYAAGHLLVSLLIAGLAAALVFLLWYPSPMAALLNVAHIYSILLVVDACCGPLLTLILAAPGKPRRELISDLSLVGLIQLAALGYGLYTLETARPVALVFEQDRLVIVAKNELYTGDCKDMCPPAPGLWGTSWHIANTKTSLDSIDLSLQGVSPAMRPVTWQKWDWKSPAIQIRLQGLSALSKPSHDKLLALKGATYASRQDLYYLPLVSSKTLDWIAVFDKQGRWLDSLPVDGFH
ncbi:hypothetical protein [Chitinilyticum aquatile]|uniref:hypothetical protein n=1 Tax=Chitinilyticum aquatile TaxID=362520 RepID=UPI0005552B01|nr:hypothetical protein [Chitinilyticum aquatile]